MTKDLRARERRELEGLIRQLEKKVGQLSRENARLYKMMQRVDSSGQQKDIEKYQNIKKNKAFLCSACGHDKSKVIELSVRDGNKKKFEICLSCKTRKKVE